VSVAVDPFTLLRRSFVQRRLQAAGAVFEKLGDAAIAAEIGDPAPAGLALVDLSPLPRTGFKGRGALAWLEAQGVRLEPTPNRAFAQAGGSLALVLAATEALVLGPLDGDATGVARLEDAWTLESAPGCYLMPRRDSHFWFALAGRAVPAMLAKLCGVDLRPKAFPAGSIAQTSVARTSAIVALATTTPVPLFHCLGDSAQAGYMLAVLEDAMAEHGGRLAGLRALERLVAGGTNDSRSGEG
jgi:sarcosine oxidase, subunit gamma